VSTIGIKIADGNYYPIIDASAVGKKRLVLTTVKDNQANVQVDLYKGEDDSIETAAYIGSLVLENLDPAGRGEPGFELIIGIDEENNLNASLGDEITGEKQSLSFVLDSLGEADELDLPDFDLDASVEPTSEVTSLEEEQFDETPFDETSFDETPFEDEQFEEEDFGEEKFEEEPPPVAEQRRTNPGLLIIFVILGLIIIGLLAFLLYRSFQGEETPRLFARLTENRTEAAGGADPGGGAEEAAVAGEDAADAKTAAADAAGGKETAAADAAVAETRADAKAEAEADAGPKSAAGASDASAAAGPAAETGGVWYWIRWGDTLWDLSYSFYRTPWLYGRIAGANNIRNPDLIYANTRLFIPEL
jgi:hypothetical protein